MIYQLIKLIHILSATLLFGAGVGSAYALMRAHRTGDLRVILMTLKQIIHADWVFTTTSGIVQLLTGLYLAYLARYPLYSGWLLVAIVLFVVAMGCWIPAAWLQYRMHSHVEESVAKGVQDSPEYRRLYRIWAALGMPAFLAMMGIFYLMVFRPQF